MIDLRETELLKLLQRAATDGLDPFQSRSVEWLDRLGLLRFSKGGLLEPTDEGRAWLEAANDARRLDRLERMLELGDADCLAEWLRSGRALMPDCTKLRQLADRLLLADEQMGTGDEPEADR